MKFQYPIFENYVSDWSVRDAIRELVANGLDGQTENGSRFEAKHHPKRAMLSLINYNTKVDPKALYFGGTSKYGDKRLIGQYGEGLKLAMLVFARKRLKLVIRNGDEVWTPAIEPDKLGNRVLTLNIRKGRDTGNFEVEVYDVTIDGWHLIQDMFLALRPATKKDVTETGELLHDADFVGKIYVKGVYCTNRPNYSQGYNFFNLDIGRDRRIPSSWDLDYQIGKIWESLATQDSAKVRTLYNALRKDGGETEALRYLTVPNIAKIAAEEFKKEFGESSIPVASIADASELEYLGKSGVVVSKSLVQIMKDEFPTKDTLKTQLKEEILRVVQLTELTPEERKILDETLIIASNAVDEEIASMTSIVEFRDPNLFGLHKSGEIQLARKVLRSVGEAIVSLMHEYAHEHGGDGSIGHDRAMEKYLEKVINYEVNRRTEDRSSGSGKALEELLGTPAS